MAAPLKREEDLSYCRRVRLAGTTCEARSNSEKFLRMLRACAEDARQDDSVGLSLDVRVNHDCLEKPGKQHFRGSQHIVAASFGSHTVFVFDLLRGHIGAVVSQASACDQDFWTFTILPLAIGIMAPAMGILPVHCACLVDRGDGLLIAGNSGAGKSTLSASMCASGFDYLADDWTYVRCDRGVLGAYGAQARIKLMPDAVRHFPSLIAHPLRPAMNGELAREVDAAGDLSARVITCCSPRWLLLLHRSPEPGFKFAPEESQTVRRYLEGNIEPLPAEIWKLERQRALLLDRIAQLPCWRFTYGGSPQFATQVLSEFVRQRRGGLCA
jgi:hypothetical protein